MSEQTEREATLREIAKKRVVYTLPGMEALPVRRDLTFSSTSGAALQMDVYYPSLSPDKPLPLVLLPMAYPDPTARVRVYGPLTSWAQLMAASGMAAVVYGTEAPAEDVQLSLINHAAGAHGFDLDERTAVSAWGCSAGLGVLAAAPERERLSTRRI